MIKPAAALFLTLFLAFALASPALAEGAVTGQLKAPEGTPLADIKVVIMPEQTKLGKRSVKVSKKGDFFFGLVPEGKYTLGLEGTALVPVALKIHVVDTETHKDLLNFDGPAPAQPVPFDVGVSYKVTYEATIGPKETAPAARQAARSALEAVPGLIQSGDYKTAIEKSDAAITANPADAAPHYYKALALFKSGDFPGAQAEAEKTLELKPDQAGAHWLLGASLASGGKKAEAVAEFQKEIANPATE